MSQKYSGGFITKSPVAPTTSAASGIWTLDQQQQAQKAGTWPSPPIFIEDLFSTYLYTGTGSAQTITNGIDLSGSGGLLWVKSRVNPSTGIFHSLMDSARGATSGYYNVLYSNTGDAQNNPGGGSNPGTVAGGVTSFNTTGFTLTPGSSDSQLNINGTPYVSWTFREQPKFFDIVTATNVGGTNARISHNLGSVPGFVIVKAINYAGESWRCYHRSIGINGTIQLNLTDATFTLSNYWGTSAPTATDFGINWTLFSGTDYIFYFFAHDAGGFPVSGGGSTNGITCGSFTTDGSGAYSVTLGYEPQFVLMKRTDSTGDWLLMDNMRGMPVGGNDAILRPNTSGAETQTFDCANPTATGFYESTGSLGASRTFIYIAIRRGPMKTPTVGTSVYTPITYNGNGTSQTITGSVGVPDLGFGLGRTGGAAGANAWYDRLRGKELALRSTLTNGEYNASPGGEGTMTNVMNGMRVENTYGILNDASTAYVLYFMSRAPGFFDEVCYTGTGANTTFTHNLGVAPEMMIVKGRSVNANWAIYTATTGATKSLFFTDSAAGTYSVIWNDTAPTASVFSVGTAGTTNSSGGTYIAYLFATVAGVSKVGSYTGTGALQTINCGFTSGARFVLIKRTDSTGNWYTYDSVRGITSGNDPYLFLDVAAAEVTGTNYVDTDTTGFKVTAAAPAGLNANGGSYIFLAIA